MNAADFRAIRETTGFSQRTVAEGLGVSERAVKYWERDLRPVPRRVAEWMEGRLAEHDSIVGRTVEEVLNMASDMGTVRIDGDEVVQEEELPPIDLTYWRSQADYDERGRDEGDVGAVNARARAIASQLRDLGFEVEFRYG